MSIIGEVLNIAPPEKWVEEAICPQVGDWDLWFPEGGTNPRDARKVCLQCPVRADCLEWAIRTGQPYGVYGGFTDGERKSLLRGRNPIRGPGTPVRKALPGRRSNGHAIACRCPICQQVAA